MSDINTSKVDGNTVSASEFNQLAEIDNLISTSGQTPSTANLEQQSIASARYSSAGNFFTDSGTANAYVLSPVSPFKSPVSSTAGEGYFNGMVIRFRAGNANSGASTVNVNNAGSKSLVKSDGSTALTTGDIPANTEVEFVYNGTNFVQSLGKVPATTTTQGITFLSNPITISNNATDANNDIDFSAGNIEFSDGSGQATYAGGTGQLDVLFGTGNGMLATGSKAINSTYHLYMATNLTTGVSKPLAILGVAGTAPDPTSVLPSGYTKFDRRGSILTDGSGNIRAFTQNELLFSLITPLISQNVNILTNSRLAYAIDVPKGIKVLANIFGAVSKNVSGSSQTYVSDLATTDIDPILLSGFYTMQCNLSYNSNAEIFRMTNTSAQIGIRTNNNGGANSTNVIVMTLGWYDSLLKY